MRKTFWPLPDLAGPRAREKLSDLVTCVCHGQTGPQNLLAMARLRILDTIYLRDFQLSAVIGLDAWNRPGKSQPITLSLQLQLDTSSASTSDDITHTFSYGHICKDVTANLDGKIFHSLNDLVIGITDLANNWPGEILKVQAVAPKGVLRVDGGYGREVVLRRVEVIDKGFMHLQWRVDTLGWFIKGLKLACIIGVNPHERLERQNVCIDLKLPGEMERPEVDFHKGGFDNWRNLVKRICEVSGTKCSTHNMTLYLSRRRLLKLLLSRPWRHWQD